MTKSICIIFALTCALSLASAGSPSTHKWMTSAEVRKANTTTALIKSFIDYPELAQEYSDYCAERILPDFKTRTHSAAMQFVQLLMAFDRFSASVFDDTGARNDTLARDLWQCDAAFDTSREGLHACLAVLSNPPIGAKVPTLVRMQSLFDGAASEMATGCEATQARMLSMNIANLRTAMDEMLEASRNEAAAEFAKQRTQSKDEIAALLAAATKTMTDTTAGQILAGARPMVQEKERVLIATIVSSALLAYMYKHSPATTFEHGRFIIAPFVIHATWEWSILCMEKVASYIIWPVVTVHPSSFQPMQTDSLVFKCSIGICWVLCVTFASNLAAVVAQIVLRPHTQYTRDREPCIAATTETYATPTRAEHTHTRAEGEPPLETPSRAAARPRPSIDPAMFARMAQRAQAHHAGNN